MIIHTTFTFLSDERYTEDTMPPWICVVRTLPLFFLQIFFTSTFVLVFVFMPATSHAYTVVNAVTYPSNKNIGAAVWSQTGGPYVVEGNVYIRYGSLTIEPGTIVKFAPGAVLAIHASVPVTIRGRADDPVFFTSYADDSIGGDTNATPNSDSQTAEPDSQLPQ
jgi:hypothetical protein